MATLFTFPTSIPRTREFTVPASLLEGKSLPHFFHYRQDGKIYGPVSSHKTGKRAICVFQNRRGISLSHPFYIQVPLEGFLPLSEPQTRMLLNDLDCHNHPLAAMDLLSFSLSKEILNVRLIRQKPRMSISEFSWKIDRKEIRKLSGKIQSDLKSIARDQSQTLKRENLLKLRLAGRELFTKIFKDGYFVDYFSGLTNGNLAIQLPKELFFLPFEHMALKELFLLDFRITRMVEHKPGWSIDLGPEREGMLLLHDGSEKHFEKEAEILVNQWAEFPGTYATSMDVQSASLQRIRELGMASRHLHYIGHSQINEKSYKWVFSRKKALHLTEEYPPEFIFADSCHDRFYTEAFHGILEILFRKGLRLWISGNADIRVQGDQFSRCFYENLNQVGHFGQALLHSRRMSAEKGHSSFLQYLAVGDHNFSMRRVPK